MHSTWLTVCVHHTLNVTYLEVKYCFVSWLTSLLEYFQIKILFLIIKFYKTTGNQIKDETNYSKKCQQKFLITFQELWCESAMKHSLHLAFNTPMKKRDGIQSIKTRPPAMTGLCNELDGVIDGML